MAQASEAAASEEEEKEEAEAEALASLWVVQAFFPLASADAILVKEFP